ncbi:DUF1731 domain-containing protein [Bremerella sp. JC817]|uniref:epimerase n=1 Tax=Bremerella sp. JC817 TaxID=3231756 RepID=UPI003457E234
METSTDLRPIVIAGGSGFLGISLANHLARLGQPVVILSRNVPRIDGNWTHVSWDGRKPGPWSHCLEGAAGVVNLAGRTVDCIKTPAHQDEILRSRIESTRSLGQAMRTLSAPPPVWVQMGTAHIYGDPAVSRCDESSAFGIGFAPMVGQAWEAEFASAKLPDQRGIVLRTSFVIGKDRGVGGGALARLAMLTRWGLGGKIGSGHQGISWIHEADMNRLFEKALTDPSMSGAYIASSPNPVPQVEFMRGLREAVRMPIGLPAFRWMVQIGTPWLLNTDPELALLGRYVIPQRLLNDGFSFQFPEVKSALADLLA